MKRSARLYERDTPDPDQPPHEPESIEEIRRVLCDAMGIDAHEPWWWEEAARRMWAYRISRESLRVYDVSTVGARIRTAREIAGWSQKQLAARAKVHPLDIVGVEAGNDMRADKFGRVCLALRLSPRWALGDTDEGGPPCPKRGVMRRQFYPNWAYWSRKEKNKVMAKAELERLRGLRPPKPKPPVHPSPDASGHE